MYPLLIRARPTREVAWAVANAVCLFSHLVAVAATTIAVPVAAALFERNTFREQSARRTRATMRCRACLLALAHVRTGRN